MNETLKMLDRNKRKMYLRGVLPLFIFTAMLVAYVSFDIYDEYFEKPFSDVQLVAVTPVEGGYRIQATFLKNNGEFVRIAPIIYQDGIPNRGGVIKHDQPETVDDDRLAGKQFLDITVLTDEPSPEKIILSVEHELVTNSGVTYKETNEFIVIQQMQLQGISK